MIRATICCCITIGIVLLAGLLTDRGTPKAAEEIDTNFDHLKPLLDRIAKVTPTKLYEGLPHPSAEPEVFEQELKSKRSRESHHFRFYEPPLTLAGVDRTSIAQLFSNPTSFQDFGGGSFCGGFHPDYLIEWHNGNEVYQAQLCLGCGEMIFFGPDHAVLCGINEKAFGALARILYPYRTNRPKPHFDIIEEAAKSDAEK
jgi:hypothetical protein